MTSGSYLFCEEAPLRPYRILSMTIRCPTDYNLIHYAMDQYCCNTDVKLRSTIKNELLLCCAHGSMVLLFVVLATYRTCRHRTYHHWIALRLVHPVRVRCNLVHPFGIHVVVYCYLFFVQCVVLVLFPSSYNSTGCSNLTSASSSPWSTPNGSPSTPFVVYHPLFKSTTL